MTTKQLRTIGALVLAVTPLGALLGVLSVYTLLTLIDALGVFW